MILLFISLARMVNEYLSVGLASVVETILGYYINVTNYIFFPFELFLKITINQIYKDVIILWFSGHAIFFRVILALIRVTWKDHYHKVNEFGLTNGKYFFHVHGKWYKFTTILQARFGHYIEVMKPSYSKFTYFIAGIIFWPYFIYRMIKGPYVLKQNRSGHIWTAGSIDSARRDLSKGNAHSVVMNMKYVLLFQMAAVFSALAYAVVAGAYGL